MALTDFELKCLRYDLVELAHIEYTDVLNELLDHYATLTEQQMTKGFTFDDASRWAWAKLEAGKGLQAIQAAFIKSTKDQIRAQHVKVLKDFFQWPTVLTTGLIALLVFSIVPIISVKWVISILSFIGLTPALFLLWGYIYGCQNQRDRNQIIWKYMCRQGLLIANFIQLGLNLPTIFVENGIQSTRIFLQTYPAVSVLIGLAMLLYTSSFIQLFRHQYKYKLT